MLLLWGALCRLCLSCHVYFALMTTQVEDAMMCSTWSIGGNDDRTFAALIDSVRIYDHRVGACVYNLPSAKTGYTRHFQTGNRLRL